MSNIPGVPEGSSPEPQVKSPAPDVLKPVNPESSKLAVNIKADLGQPNPDPDKILGGIAQSEVPALDPQTEEKIEDEQETLVAESEISSLSGTHLIENLNKRIQNGNTPDVLVLDMDGTVFDLAIVEDGSRQKVGDNTETSEILKEQHIPLIMDTARGEWSEGADAELKMFNLSAPEAVIAAVGTKIYLRKDGQLIQDTEYAEIIKQQPIKYIEDGQPTTTTYDAQLLKPLVVAKINDEFKDRGISTVDVDGNQDGGAGFISITVDKMSEKDVEALIHHIQDNFHGLKAVASEDLQRIAEGSFSGWIKIAPHSAGKDGALKYLLSKIAQEINPNNTENNKPIAHVVADASPDIGILAMGTNGNEPFKIKQYAVSNLSERARHRLTGVLNMHHNQIPQGSPQAHLVELHSPASEGVAIVARIIRDGAPQLQV